MPYVASVFMTLGLPALLHTREAKKISHVIPMNAGIKAIYSGEQTCSHQVVVKLNFLFWAGPQLIETSASGLCQSLSIDFAIPFAMIFDINAQRSGRIFTHLHGDTLHRLYDRFFVDSVAALGSTRFPFDSWSAITFDCMDELGPFCRRNVFLQSNLTSRMSSL